MNPTKKEAPALTGAIRGHRVSENIHQHLQRVKSTWQREARRLAGEYLTTGRETHREAFERHMGGILQQMRRAL
jgi:hypothetical protein